MSLISLNKLSLIQQEETYSYCCVTWCYIKHSLCKQCVCVNVENLSLEAIN